MADARGSNPRTARCAGSTPVMGTRLEEEKIMIHATDGTFDQDISGSEPVLVKFGAEWCGPCKSVAPTLDALATEYSGRVKFLSVDIDSTSIAGKYNIRGIPTILIFKNGQVVNTIVGAQSKGRLQLAIDSVLV